MMMRKMMFKPSLKKMKGLTLLETMFALALGVLVLIAIMLIYNGTKKSGAQSKVISDVTAIVAAYQNYISAGLGTPTISAVQDAGYLAGSNGIIMDPYGQSYDAQAITSGTVPITISGLPASSDQCTQIGQMLGNPTTATGKPTGTDCAFNMPL